MQAANDEHFKLKEELDKLIKESSEWNELEKAKAEEKGFHESIGLLKERGRLEPLKKQTGNFAGMSGKQFEIAALKIMTDHVFPDLRRLEFGTSEAPEIPREAELTLLSNLTMGTCFEIDQMIILTNDDPANKPVEVIGLVEVKRNINDIAKSFQQLQIVLAWFTQSKERYDSNQFKTKGNPSGNFEKPIYHEEDGQKYMFIKESFKRFFVDPECNYFIDRVYYITKPRQIKGMNSGEENKLSFRLSTDFTLEPNLEQLTNQRLIRMRNYVEETFDKFQAINLLQLYKSKSHWANQMLLAVPVELVSRIDSEDSLTDLGPRFALEEKDATDN